MDKISELLFHEYSEKKEMIEKGFAKWRFLAFYGGFIELTIVWLEEYLDMIEMTLNMYRIKNIQFIGLSEKLQRLRQNAERTIQYQVNCLCF